ncbi:AGAP012173-PA-like protein [Anopheles sinensis]|uniref:AGAP012173-PA-like protein n=1 Tax=Anopheles sinensis TaxID=74873 RepID=A0A084WHY7_ANOSI|nr:AGAP012173-PA-like protein [Anopheles sinensis]
MSEIPLFLSMELELLLPIVKQRVDLKSSTISLEIVKQCDQRFEPLRMMEIFVERKLNIANTEKSGATDAAGYTSGARVNADLQNEWNLRIHSLLALHVVIDEKDRLSLLTSEERKDALQYIQNVNRGIVKSGIVDGAVDNVPIFIHRLFAEFFAARWFYVHQDRDGVKEFLKWNIYDNNAKEEIKHLIDRMAPK